MLKKLTCTFLVFWLPLFFGAASVVASEMQIASSIESAHIETISIEAMSMQQSTQADKSSIELNNTHDCCKKQNAQHHCTHCDLCLNFAFYSTNFNQQISLFKTPTNQHIAWVAGSHINSPNHRPPISA